MKYGKNNIRVMDTYEIKLFNKENTDQKRTETMNVQETFDVVKTKAWLTGCYKNWYSTEQIDHYRKNTSKQYDQEHLKIYWQVEEITKCGNPFCLIEF